MKAMNGHNVGKGDKFALLSGHSLMSQNLNVCAATKWTITNSQTVFKAYGREIGFLLFVNHYTLSADTPNNTLKARRPRVVPDLLSQ